jgi:PAS domain-containing protein
MRVEVANSTPDYSQQASIRLAGESSKLSLDKPVGKRKQAEQKIAKSEAQYRRLFETAQDGILILDGCTGQIIDVNPFLINMLGYRREDFSGKSAHSKISRHLKPPFNSYEKRPISVTKICHLKQKTGSRFK